MGTCLAEMRALDTVQVLHQTVVSLRQALEGYQIELDSLKSSSNKANVTSVDFLGTIEKLSAENQALRKKLSSLSSSALQEKPVILKPIEPPPYLKEGNSKSLMEAQKSESSNRDNRESAQEQVSEEEKENVMEEKPVQNIVNVTDPMEEEKESQALVSKNEAEKVMQGLEETEEVDDIELIFTTDDTKELCTLQEDMVSINEADAWQSKHSQSVFADTDISKCGVLNDGEHPNQSARRNTVAHSFSLYRPLSQRKNSYGNKLPTQSSVVKFVDTAMNVRPILVENNNPTNESEAQTEISALPQHWKSESYLAHHKVSHNFTTLPSKFSLSPENIPPRKQSLKLCEKTQEARRILLSDINFTSMVPELSQSFDHLCQIQEDFGITSLCKNYPRAFSFMKNTDYIMSPGYGSQIPWSPSQHSSWEQCECSLMSMSPSSPLDLAGNRNRRHSFQPTALSLDSGWNNRQIWSSVPSSPVHCRSVSLSASCQPVSRCLRSASALNHNTRKPKPFSRARNRVAFMERKFGTSMPDLREPDSGGESTESLIDDSEQSLRKSIDAITTGSDPLTPCPFLRRCSEPRFRFASPKRTNHRPFIVKSPYELKLNQLVKVITQEGRIVNGKVKYVGPIKGKTDTWVGVQLDFPITSGTNGAIQDNRYFECEEHCGVFVPFKKVVLAWKA
ncbi:unnamed protein product [Bemisia tabaci]|uniref:CAP-Gly domain-containing protein n=1 Tax=Bemisia tabaci TaxID=7038 RepID=A0A9P0CAT4_BEMTA|nr:unnamed protein product [Bemisia tabaci]